MPKIKSDYFKIFVDFLKKNQSVDNPIFCFHDNKGKVIHIINEKASLPSTIQKHIILERMDLSLNYPFKEFNPDSKSNNLYQDFRPDLIVNSSGFFTCLPYTSLHSTKIKKNLFLGRIYFNNLHPNLFTPGITGSILVDLTLETLVGFNDHFFELFRNTVSSPGELLNKPLKYFFSPTPSEYQEKHQSQFPSTMKMADRVLSWCSEEDRTLASMVKDESSPVEEILGLPENHGIYSRIKTSINTETDDFELTLQVRSMSGNFPVFFLSAPEIIKPEWEIDYNGYMAGLEHATKRPIIKKKGLIAACGEKNEDYKGSYTLVFAKRGRCFSLYCNGLKLIGLFDRNIILHERADLFVAARSPDDFLISALFLTKSKSAPRSSDTDDLLVVDLVAPVSRPFLLDPFYTPFFSKTKFLSIGGFLFTDISEFHNKSKRFETRLAEEIRENALLKKMVRRYNYRDVAVIWGTSQAMEKLRRNAESIAKTDATVLIEGETGTGKEVISRHIHECSNRSNGPFVKVDCSTVPINLIESTLFGHVKGAFTGAISDNIGMLRSADHGTIFLDEAGNLSMEFQAKLLQFFNDLTVAPIGGTSVFKVDVRCIIASNQSLSTMVRQGKFREDLYYRINVLYLHLPPLRERSEDLPLLCDYFISQYSRMHKKQAKHLSTEALLKIKDYAWPGNIRELQNIIQHAVVFSRNNEIEVQDIQLPLRHTEPLSKPERKPRSPFSIDATDPAIIERALRESNGVVKKAAASLDINRGTLYNYLKKRDIRPNSFRRGLGR